MDKPYKCTVDGCSASYKRKFQLEIHSRKHSGEKPFKCNIPGCSLAYTNPAHLKRHICLVHEKLCEVVCPVEGCGLVLSNKYSLKKHYDRNHKVVFTCAECSESFKKKWQLKQHLHRHNGKLPFRCSTCNINFTALHLYNKHKRNHRTYTCDCGEEFGRWTLFCIHRRHSCNLKKIDHKCIICNKIFTTKTNLTQHSLSHIEESHEDVYHCPYMNCRRSYKYKKNLHAHIASLHELVNNDDKIKCTKPGCEQILKSERNLRRHMKNVHNDLPKKKKEPKPRRDRGKFKKSMVSIMSGVELPLKEHLTAINSDKSENKVFTENKNVILQSSAPNNVNIQNTKNNENSCKLDISKEQKDSTKVSGNADDSLLLNDNIKNKTKTCDNPTYRNEEEEKQMLVKIVSGIQQPVQMKNLPPEYEENFRSDDVLLHYCNDVLKTLQEHLSETPNLVQV